MAKLFANRGDPDQMPHPAASNLGLHCLPITLLRVSQLKWVKVCELSAKQRIHMKCKVLFSLKTNFNNNKKKKKKKINK